MELIEKITVVLKPDSGQRAYMGLSEVDLTVDVLEFNDGSIRVTLPTFDPEIHTHRYLHVNAFVKSLNDLMVVSQVKEIIERLSETPKNTYFNILSTPYTRYDRPMFESGIDGFGAKCFALFTNALKFDCVTFLDCHSDVMLNHVENSFDKLPQIEMARSVIGANITDYNFVAPDKGATKKNPDADLVCNKVRDPETGYISGMELIMNDPHDLNLPFLVIDDICEGGRTFLGVAELLEENYPDNQRELYITHGVFSNVASIVNLCEKYSKIHIYIMRSSLYNSLHEFEQNKLNVKYLVNI